MYVSPKPLQVDCIDYICDNFQILRDNSCMSNVSPEQLFSFSTHLRDRDVCIPRVISEVLLEKLSAKGCLSDETINIFDAPTSNLRNVYIPDGGLLSNQSLQFLKNHKIKSLTIFKLKTTINDLLEALGDWSVQNLEFLNVSGGNFRINAVYPILADLSKLKNLRCLNVSNTVFNNYGLDIVTSHLHHLETLDISNTHVQDISPLRNCKHTLKGLIMYQLQVPGREHVIVDLTQLQILDLSEDPTKQPPSCLFRYCDISSILSNEYVLPDLISLDISGKNYEVDILFNFIQRHPKLQFLGLVCSDSCTDPYLIDPKNPNYNPNLKVAGMATEEQVFRGLMRPAYKTRSTYIQKLLYMLFRVSLGYNEARLDSINLVLDSVRRHQDEFSVQMAGTACLYNLTKGDLSQKIHPDVLKDVVSACLDAMERYPSDYQLQKNTLLTLCNDRILQDITIEKYRCAKLVLDCLCSFEDASMNKMSVAICSILASKLSTHDTSLLGSNARYMKKMLRIAREKIESKTTDMALRFTLSALWNLTDESPDTCKVFLSANGLALFQLALEHFLDDSSIETKILGLINNIAEVKDLRKHIIKSKLILKLRALLHSSQIDVSYFSAGIIAHLACEGNAVWVGKEISRLVLLEELGTVVSQWKPPESEMVAYRSFKPFIPLLECPDAPVQLWAVWAMNHVCTKNPPRYCPMLKVERVSYLLNSMNADPNIDVQVRKLVNSIIEYVHCDLNDHYYETEESKTTGCSLMEV